EEGELSRSWKEVCDYCIGCGMCAVECPSGVDIPRLIAEARIRFADKNGLAPADLFLSEADLGCALMSRFAPLANLASRNGMSRRLIELVAGVDRRRRLPEFNWPAKPVTRKKSSTAGDRPRVALFLDLFARYNDPSLAGTVVTLLEELLDAEVVVPRLGSCGITAMLYGNRRTAFSLVEKNIDTLSSLVDRGYKVVSQEPTSVLSLRVEYPRWVDNPDARKIAANTYELFEFLGMIEEQGGLLRPMPDNAIPERELVYHAPCHLKALGIGWPAQKFLSRIRGLRIVDSESACCGMAGTFGMKTENYELSMRIGRALLEKMESGSVSAGVSECSTCRMQMESCGKMTFHPAELVALAYGLVELDVPE
ncbi:MAG: heterodisulfide reductase-related iron-sulfur binding cluster, partial [Gemmatimonadota bacterium]|nr:heterodisulfide reductase-related iron-sulfur binding cluster [Gemmatimonadota bacterium]